MRSHSQGQRFPGGSEVKNLPAMQETRVQPLGWEDPWEKVTAAHSSTLTTIPRTEKPGGLQSMGSQAVTKRLSLSPALTGTGQEDSERLFLGRRSAQWQAGRRPGGPTERGLGTVCQSRVSLIFDVKEDDSLDFFFFNHQTGRRRHSQLRDHSRSSRREVARLATLRPAKC